MRHDGSGEFPGLPVQHGRVDASGVHAGGARGVDGAVGMEVGPDGGKNPG